MVIGEFSIDYTNYDLTDWLNDLIIYLIEIDRRNTFYWSLIIPSEYGLLKEDYTIN